MNEPTAAPATPEVNAAPAAKGDAAPVKAEAPKASSPAVKVDENGVAAETPKKIWKLKINGKEVDYDASDEAKLQRDIQKVYGIEEKAKTASEQAGQAEKLLTMMTSDYKGFEKQCKAMGIDHEKLATDILYAKIRRDNLTPEQRELEAYKEREAEAAAKAKADEEAAKVADVQRKTQEWASKFEKDCEAALKANALPKTRLSLALIAQYIDAGLANKQELSVEQVLPYVARDLKEIHTSTMGKLDGDELLSYIGEELSNKIAKARVDRYKKSQVVATPVKSDGAPKPSSQDERLNKILKAKGPRAYFAELRKIKSESGIGMFPGKE